MRCGADGYHLRAAPVVDVGGGTSGSVYGGKYKRADDDDYGGGGGGRRRPVQRERATSRDSFSVFYGDGEVDR